MDQLQKQIFWSLELVARKIKLSSGETDQLKLSALNMLMHGRISVEDLYGQMTKYIPDAPSIMAEAVNLTPSDLLDQVVNGKALAEAILPKFAEKLEKAYA